MGMETIMPPISAVGRWVKTAFVRGRVKEVQWGPERHWRYRQWYYLIESDRFEDHWVLETELFDIWTQ